MKKVLSGLIEKQQSSYEALFAICETQRDLLKSGKSDEKLEEILKQREKILSGIADTDVKIRETAQKTAPDPTGIKKLEKILKKIVALDAESHEILQKRKSKVAEQMKTMHKGTAAIKGYGMDAGKPSGRFISRKG